MLHQSVRNAPGKEALARANTAPEKQANVFGTYFCPLVNVSVGVLHLRVAAVIVRKCPVAHFSIGESIRFQAVNQTEVLLLVDDCFLLLSFHPAALTFYRVAVSQNRHSLVPLKKGLLWGVTLSTVQQTICAEVVFRLWCSTAALDQRVDCCFSSHKLSPSL